MSVAIGARSVAIMSRSGTSSRDQALSVSSLSHEADVPISFVHVCTMIVLSRDHAKYIHK